MNTKRPQDETLLETLKHNFHKDKFLIQLTLDPETGKYEPYYSWSDLNRETLHRLGFKDAVKFHDDLRYSGVKTYIKLNGFVEAPRPNMETSSTMYDFYMSDAPHDFQKGLTQTKFASLDTKQLMVAIPVVIGLIIGFYFLFMRG